MADELLRNFTATARPPRARRKKAAQASPTRFELPNKPPIWGRVARNRRDIQHNQAEGSAEAHRHWAAMATDAQAAEVDLEWAAFWDTRRLLLKLMSPEIADD